MIAAREERISRKLEAKRLAQQEAFDANARAGRRTFVITNSDHARAREHCIAEGLYLEAVVMRDQLPELMALIEEADHIDRLVIDSSVDLSLRELFSLLWAARTSDVAVHVLGQFDLRPHRLLIAVLT